MAVKRCVLFVAHTHGDGDFRAITTHHFDLEPLHASSITTRIRALGQVLASVLLVEDEKGRKLFPSRGEGLTDAEYKEFLASCEDWALGR